MECLDGIDFEGKKTLEIGLGQGADSEQIIQRGADWSGVDLTPESIHRVRSRLELKGLPYNKLKQGSALALPFEDNSFDIVYSHGVLHHIPDIDLAQKEIHRVLKPGGQLVAMLYAKWSLNYLISIGVVRRLGLLALMALKHNPGGIYGQHIENAKTMGLLNYLKMEKFTHHNTDGPLNPYAIVYDLPKVKEHFSSFSISKHYKRFMHAPLVPIKWQPLQKSLGWHLWVHLTPNK